MDIPYIIEKPCENHDLDSNPSLDDLLHLEAWTTDFVKRFISKKVG